MIHFDQVSFSYEKNTPVLNAVDLVLNPGLTLLLGPNGCGKSTLLKLAAGIEKPDSGHVTINGYDLWKDEVSARKLLAYLPEQPDLTPYATIKEIINLVCRLRIEPLKKGEEALKFVDLHDSSHRTVRELSQGQRRRAVFAACLIGNPKYVLLDEPFEGMDRSIQNEIYDWIVRNIQNSASVVIVSHLIEPFIELTTEAATIKNGEAIIFKELPENVEKKFSFLEGISKGVF